MENKLATEQTEKLDACKTAEEVNDAVEKDSNGLTDEQLEEIAGGITSNIGFVRCEKCGKFVSTSSYLLHLRACKRTAPITRER